jgi:outer membrane protein assembly factor BamB
MVVPNKIQVTVIIALLLVSALSASALSQTKVNAQTNTASASLNQYEWPQFQGDQSFTRFSAGPAPNTSNVLWKANITGIQPYLSAFDGLIYVGTNTSMVALNQDGTIAWQTPIPMNGTWPIAYKIDNSHMIVESSCLDPQTGSILWTSSQFCADTGIFSANVYSPDTKMFYTKEGSYISAWDFADPSNPPTLAWTTYVPGGGKTGLGTTYGGGLVFPGSFENLQIALNATTGTVAWQTRTKGPMIFDGAYSNGMYYHGGTDDDTMYCFNATNGNIIWTYTPVGDTDGYFVTGPAIGYGMVYEMNKDGYFYALNMYSGALVWKYKSPDATLLWPGMPSVADGKVYVTTSENAEYGGQTGTSQFACFNAYTGQVIWTLPIEALAPRESQIVAYGNLYIIPGTVTTSVDQINGNEYNLVKELWCIGSNNQTVSNWPMWRADPTHSSTAVTGPTSLSLSWKFTTNGSVASSPTVVNGIVYFGSEDHNIYAVGAYSGNLIWSFPTKDAQVSSVAVVNGKVYTGGDDGYVYCLDANSGALIWQTFVNGDLPYTYGSIVLKSSPIVSGNVVYVGSLDGNLYALDANSGNIVWKFNAQGPILCSPAADGSAVYFTAQQPTSGVLYKLDASTGSVIWQQQIPYEYQFTGGEEMMGSPSVAAGMVFASSDLRSYYGIDASSGKILWNFTDPQAMEFIVSSPIYVQGQVYIIDKFSITSLNATNGKTIWSFYTGDETYISPSYADGKIYIVTSERHIYILDANNKGNKIANATEPSSSWSSPTIANGNLYIGCNDWNLYCYTNNINTNVQPTPTPIPTLTHNAVPITLFDAALAAVATAVIVGTVVLGYVIRKRARKQAL